MEFVLWERMGHKLTSFFHIGLYAPGKNDICYRYPKKRILEHRNEKVLLLFLKAWKL